MLLQLLPGCTLRGAMSSFFFMRQPDSTRTLPLFRFVLCAAALFGSAQPLAAQTDSSSSKVLGASKEDIRIENLTALNSKGDDATAFISPSDGAIYFTSSREGKQIIYVSKRLPST